MGGGWHDPASPLSVLRRLKGDLDGFGGAEEENGGCARADAAVGDVPGGAAAVDAPAVVAGGGIVGEQRLAAREADLSAVAAAAEVEIGLAAGDAVEQVGVMAQGDAH